jgi:small-conductance mechanosensitive channel
MNKKKRLLTFVIAFFAFSIPLFAIVSGQSLTNILKDLWTEMQLGYQQRTEAQQRFVEDYEGQHQKLMDIITKSNERSILLYTQEQNMTFDLAYALKKVTSDYNNYNKDISPYEHIVHSLDIEIDRYARLIEALRRLPPMMKEIEIEILPDSLLYHNDSLDLYFSTTASILEKEVIRISVKDTLSSPVILDAEGEIYRDSCIRYASNLLKMYADNRAMVKADSTHYQEAYMRMKETYNYAQSQYQELEDYVFIDGQTPFLEIMSNPQYYWSIVMSDLRGQYDFREIDNNDSMPADTTALSSEVAAEEPAVGTEEGGNFWGNLSSKGVNAMLVVVLGIQLVGLIIAWVLTSLIVLLLARIFKRRRFIPKKQLSIFSIFLGTIVYFLVVGFTLHGDDYVMLSAKHVNTLLWLLIAITGSLMLRVKPEQIRHSFRLYIPTFLIAIVIIACRVTFVPDRLMNFMFPPILLLIVLRQLFFSIRESGKATPIDSVLGWISLAIYLISFGFAFFGYTFAALLVLIWWYFQLAMLLTIVCIVDLVSRYKEKRLNKRIDAMRERITYVSGNDRESLLFGATWFHDFIKQVAIPSLLLLSLPFCIRMSLNVFDFNDLYDKIFNIPFVQLVDKNGYETLRISGKSIIGLFILFFVLRYFNRAIHAIYQYVRYATFMRKHNRTAIRDNEINLSLGNSILSVLVWMAYIIVVVAVWRIPMGSLSLVAGGLSAGIGLALKDILNNFIYGIQLMGGRLRVGDWIECDGVRGRVVAINYQFVQIETLDGTEMSFLNASLFGKSFNNLTRNNSYEFAKIIVGVAYGTDIKKVREVLVNAMQQMRTKDRYGRDIVDPKYGIKVVVSDMSDSSVDIAVKQYVLVAERIGYVDRSKEVIYEALNDANISIPFPQCDVHLIHDESNNKKDESNNKEE